VSAGSLDQLYSQHIQTLMKRTDRSLAAAGYDALVISAGSPPTQFLDDQDYSYKVNPHFKAWAPIVDNPRSLLVYRPGAPPQVLFHQSDDYWHKPARLPDEPWTSALTVTPLPDPSKAAAYWADLGRVAFIGAPENFTGVEASHVNDAGLLTHLHYDRAVKTPYELECMRRASALGARGHRAALTAFREGASEYEAHMRYLAACVLREEELPYNNIVAYNENAAVLHYQHLERRAPTELRSFLIDAGAQFRGYASDITRTYAASTGRFADLIDALDAAQLRLCDEIVAGRDFRDVHLSAHRLLGDVMYELGLTKLPGQQALEQGVTAVFFPHGIGHLLGLQVHDVGGVMADLKGGERKRPDGHPYLRLTRLLEPGVVVTVEPGIYFIDSLLATARGNEKRPFIDWDMVEELRPYGGIRIEDNVLTTASTPENMTRDAFHALRATFNG
jgi:Xaa-Pro dipeptidase